MRPGLTIPRLLRTRLHPRKVVPCPTQSAKQRCPPRRARAQRRLRETTPGSSGPAAPAPRGYHTWHAAAWSPDPSVRNAFSVLGVHRATCSETPPPPQLVRSQHTRCSHSRHPVKNEGRISVSWLRLHSKPAKTCEKVVLFLTLEPRPVAASSMSGTEVLLVSSSCDIPSARNRLLSKATASYRRCLFYPRR